MKTRPTLIIFAGANGSGKTTAAKHLLPKKHILEFVNADEIAHGLSPLNPDSQRVQAGKLVIGRVRELISRKQSFAIETTLSGKTLASLLRRARHQGYSVSMFYIYTGDVAVNIRRIRQRVEQGGHNVPGPDVRRRRKRSLHNLFRLYYDLCDKIAIYDFTGEKPVLIAFRELGLPVIVTGVLQSAWGKLKKDAGIQ